MLPIFRSEAQLRLLAELLLHPETEYGITELAERMGLPQATVSRETTRLTEAGVLEARPVGRNRLLRAATESTVYPELSALLRKTMGAPAVLAELLGEVDGADTVLIYGSWARRFHGEDGKEPGDVDVLVIGDADPRAVRAVADEATERLGKDVSITTLSAQEWARPRSGFLRQVKSGDLVTVLD